MVEAGRMLLRHSRYALFGPSRQGSCANGVSTMPGRLYPHGHPLPWPQCWADRLEQWTRLSPTSRVLLVNGVERRFEPCLLVLDGRNVRYVAVLLGPIPERSQRST